MIVGSATRKCVNCGKIFESKAWNAKSCSGYCNLKQWRNANPEHNRQIKRDWRRRNGVVEKGSPEHRQMARQQFHYSGEKHPSWKGEEVSYRNLHKWVERKLGRPEKCEFANDTCSGRFQWSNVSGQYYRELGDWQRLCGSHHKRLDNQRRLACLS